MKVRYIFVTLIITMLFVTNLYAETTAKQIFEVECAKRLIQGDDIIKVIRVDDPENPFVSIYFTTIKSGKLLAFADPSNTSIATRLTGEIPIDKKGKQIINKNTNLDIVHVKKSIGTKMMKIARSYDPEKNALIYLVYTTKAIEGSLKHSISVVPLGKPLTP